MTTVNIIGTGNVAYHLAKAFAAENEIIVMQIAGRNKDTLAGFKNFARELVSINDLIAADVTIVAVSDDAVEDVYANIPFQDALVVHTSGFTSMLSRKRTKNYSGVFYPLQTFSKEDTSLTFEKIPFLIEAEEHKDEKTLLDLAQEISSNIQVVTSRQRRQIHLAAVFANNFSNYCYTLAEEICNQNDIPFETLHPLLLKTTEKAITNGPHASQTGPAKRNDENVLRTQQELLTTKAHKAVYKTMTNALKSTYGKKL